jgi:chromate transporter
MALVAAVLTLALPSVFGQMVVIICSGLLGRWALKIEPAQGQLLAAIPSREERAR